MLTMEMAGERRERRQVSRELKRRAILEAAADLVSRRGVAAVTVDDIAASSHLAKGSIYYYFRSRDELIAALLQAGWSEFLAAISSVPESDNPQGTFLDTLTALVTSYNRRPPVLGILFPLSQVVGDLPPRLIAKSEKTKARAYAIIGKRLRAAYPEQDEARLMREIGGLIFGLLRMGKEQGPVPVQTVRDAVLRLVRA
jgi:AcrR family transcriptional regulator